MFLAGTRFIGDFLLSSGELRIELLLVLFEMFEVHF